MFDQTENEYTPELVRPVEITVGERHRTLARRTISAPQTDEEAAQSTQPTIGGGTAAAVPYSDRWSCIRP